MISAKLTSVNPLQWTPFAINYEGEITFAPQCKTVMNKGGFHEEADEKYPFVPNLPVHASVYEQESKLEFRYRAEYVLSKIIAENEDDSTVAIVSHGGMINQLYQAFLKLPVTSGMTFPTSDTGIHEWMIRGEERYVLRANGTTHLTETIQ